MKFHPLALLGLLLAAPTQDAQAQGWPSWADEAFSPERRSWRSERPYDQYRGVPDTWRGSPGVVQDGGARPEIAPRAPHVVAFSAPFPANSIVIDTGARNLYYVMEGNRAYEYRISVGREGFNWTGTETISRKQHWPDWHPPAEMRERDPKLPEKMTGGLRNPLGAMALYLGNTLYRIHGTNDVKSIGQAQSSGCFRMLNAEVLHLASIAEAGTSVAVVSSLARAPGVSQLPTTPKALPEDIARSSSVAQRPIEALPADRATDYRSLREQMLRRP